MSMTNCVNYGDITSYWFVNKLSYLGGLVAAIKGLSFRMSNCLNNGKITNFNIVFQTLHISRMLGVYNNSGGAGHFDNCVNARNVRISEQGQQGTYFCELLATSLSDVTFTYCKWTNLYQQVPHGSHSSSVIMSLDKYTVIHTEWWLCTRSGVLWHRRLE